MINLVESGGADLPTQSEIFIPGGQTFHDITDMSARGIPTIAVVFGNSTAGGAYLPGMSDYVVMIKERSKVFLGGPPLVKMATGEESDDESLGGAEMHARISGLADYFAVDELDAIRLGRQIVRRLNHRKRGPGPRGPGRPPRLDPEELLGIPSRRPEAAVRPARRASPGSSTTATSTSSSRCTARRWSPAGPRSTAIPVGILANHRGVLFNEEAQKAAQFIQLANQIDTPLRVPAEHHRLHGRQGLRAARHHQGRRQDDQRRLQQPGAAPDDPHGSRRTAPATTACAAGRTARGSCSPGPTPRRR